MHMTLSVVRHLCFVTLARMHNASPLCIKLDHLDFKLDRGHALLLLKLDLLCLIFSSAMRASFSAFAISA